MTLQSSRGLSSGGESVHPSLVLLPFQRRFLSRAFAVNVDTAALSGPRALGKTRLSAHILERCLTVGDPLFRAGAEYLLAAASLDQARICFRFVRHELEDGPRGSDYTFLDSHQRIGIRHKPTNTRLRVLSSDARTAFGLVGSPLIVCDEPGAWRTIAGELLFTAIKTAQGKPQSPLRALFVGTIAPNVGGWWQELVDRGSVPGTYVMALQGNVKKWDDLREIYRVNPLARLDASFRAKLRQERDEAQRDGRLKARFISYRLNMPSMDESECLLTVEDWEHVCARPVPEREGRSVCGVDMGSSRSWSSAVAVFESGRVEAVAIAPGLPSIGDQEKRDRVPPGSYQRLIERGHLHVDAGRRVVRVEALLDKIWEWNPGTICCDRFRLPDVLDGARGRRVRVVPRIWQWSSASEDIRHLRRLSADGPLSVEAGSRDLLAVSLAAAKVINDSSGNSRLIKKMSNNVGRDDVAAAFLLGAGEAARQGIEAPA